MLEQITDDLFEVIDIKTREVAPPVKITPTQNAGGPKS